MGTLRLLECIKHNKINKLVYAASSSCYGLADTPTNENHLINPQYPYALSKHQGTELIQHWYNVYKIPYNIICIFNAYYKSKLAVHMVQFLVFKTKVI